MVDFSLSVTEEACQIIATSFGHIFLQTQNQMANILENCPKIEVDYHDFSKKESTYHFHAETNG